jgi:hypothetical protein
MTLLKSVTILTTGRVSTRTQIATTGEIRVVVQSYFLPVPYCSLGILNETPATTQGLILLPV